MYYLSTSPLMWLILGLFALAFYGAIFWAIIEFIRYLRRK